LDPVIGTPGAIPDKVRVLLSTAAASVAASSATTATATTTASGEASPTACEAAGTAPISEVATTATAITTAATTSAAPLSAASATLVATDTARPLIATWKAAILAKATGIKSREISLIRAQSIAYGSIHHERLIGAIRGHLRREFGCGFGLGGEIRSCVGLLRVLAGGAARLDGRRGLWHNSARRQLEREIEVGGCGRDLDFAAQMIEPEHIGFDDPCAGRHSVKAEHTIIVCERNQASLALGRAHGCAGDRLATRLDGSRLCKYHWQAHCQKHENFEH